VKLLLDENLSPRLVKALSDCYPGSAHVRDVGLASATDQQVWDYAIEQGFSIVSKDSDFHQRSFLFGAPPKVVWIQRNNCSTADIERMLRAHQSDIEAFLDDKHATFLQLA
jgi:predicted nuclease of predicted toxin-antitoxin system